MIHVSLASPVWCAEDVRSEGIKVMSERTVELLAKLPATSTSEGVTAAGAVPAGAALHFELTAVVIDGTGWQIADAQQAITQALPILAQCGVAPQRIRLVQIAAPEAYRDLSPQASRQLAAQLAPARPAIFFVRNTRMRPPFEAEAFGIGNTRARPELVSTIWVTRSAADLPETLAHELFHVIANSGEHSEHEANLMYDRTAPGRHQLTPAQCSTLRETGQQNRLLRK